MRQLLLNIRENNRDLTNVGVFASVDFLIAYLTLAIVILA